MNDDVLIKLFMAFFVMVVLFLLVTVALYAFAPSQIIIDCENKTIKTIQQVKFYGENIEIAYKPNLECQ